MKKVKMRDIANALGISRGTVSKALRDPDALEEATREKILQKAAEMGYRPPPQVDVSSKKAVPTMKDVAQEAGVALGTVSKVIKTAL